MPRMSLSAGSATEALETAAVSLLVPDGRYAGYFLLRRLHSFTGFLPLSFFLVQHFFINSFSLHGPEAFTGFAGGLRSLPYVGVVEFLLILAPLYFHGLLGLYLVYCGQLNVHRFGYARNWMYFLQRVTGVFTLAFVTYHLMHTRFGGTKADGLFALMAQSLANPMVFAFYLAGVVMSSYHLSNGLWGFCITWGITTGRRAQTVASVVVVLLFCILCVFSINALLGFMGIGFHLLG